MEAAQLFDYPQIQVVPAQPEHRRRPIGAIWGCVGYTVLLCFCLFKTGTIARSIFSAH